MYNKRYVRKLADKRVIWSFGVLKYPGVLSGDVVRDTTDKQVAFHVVGVGYLPKTSIRLVTEE